MPAVALSRMCIAKSPTCPNWHERMTPKGLDYDLWIGPFASVPTRRSGCLGIGAVGCPFGGGAIGDWICHVVDPSFWALDLGRAVHGAGGGHRLRSGRTGPDLSLRPRRSRFEFPARPARGPVKLVWHDGKHTIPTAPGFPGGRKEFPAPGPFFLATRG